MSQLISYPIFIIFAPICREIFTLSFEMVILDKKTDLFNFNVNGILQSLTVTFCISTNLLKDSLIDLYILSEDTLIIQGGSAKANVDL